MQKSMFIGCEQNTQKGLKVAYRAYKKVSQKVSQFWKKA